MGKKARLDMRLETQQKKELKRLAKAEGMTVTEWILKKCFDEQAKD